MPGLSQTAGNPVKLWSAPPIDGVSSTCDVVPQGSYRLYGQTMAGRYLFVVLEHAAGAEFRPITARDMNARERQNFRRLRK